MTAPAETETLGLVRLLAACRDDAAALAAALDQLGIAICLYDTEDRVVLWNESYLAFFPEQREAIAPGTPYADTLRRFFGVNLAESQRDRLERHVEAAVQRHRTQTAPFTFQLRSGRWLKVASLPMPAGGRVRLWRDTSEEQPATTRRSADRALASLDVGYAVFDGAGRFVTANKRYQELFPGIGDLVNATATYRDHLARIERDSVLEEDRARLARVAARPLPTALPVSLPLLLRHADGGWLSLEERVGEDGTLVAIWSDATRQVEADARIGELERHLRDAVESMPHALLMFDREGRLVLRNRRLAAIDQGLARALDAAPTLVRYAAWRAGFGDVSGEDAIRGDEEVTLPDRRTVAIAPFTTDAGEMLILLSDITREKAAEAELARQKDLAHQNEKLAAMGSLLAGVAHELNNPLSVVVARAMLLEEQIVDPQAGTGVRVLRQAAERCAGIVRTFLAIARAKPRERRPLALGKVLAAVADILAYGLGADDIALEIAPVPAAAMVEAEEDALHQLFLNLLVNAQHALRGAPKPRRIAVTVAVSGGSVEVVVADNGPGVPAAIRGRIFEPYFTTKQQGEGTGIGLSVCHAIVSSHGGTIAVDDAPGGGARFTVRLPQAAEAVQTEAPRPGAPASVRGRVLVVDDERDITDVLMEILTRQGLEVTVARDGMEGLLRLEEGPCDLVITDLRMPGMDGAGLLARLAERPPALRPPVIVLTGDVLSWSRARPAFDPPPLVIEKPFDPAALSQAVREALARRA
ncbi:hybrid sensor histidine kinase/response regulator [Elioraea tepidiphila]|uniref:hybrid sensor histidine kinase/response regulator n=1 Tax=Elioraea tepidiphila TaxID=457934 RepID=UPI0003688FAE|nr:PAS-domain containing protein [Elioraea tepidiphila]